MAETVLVHDPNKTSPGFPTETYLAEVQQLIDQTQNEGGSPVFEKIEAEYHALTIAESILARRLAGR